MRKIIKSLINFYNNWYGIIDGIIYLCLLSVFTSTAGTITLLALLVLDAFTWYKNIFKNRKNKRELFATISQNNAMCIYGGIGCGKSTLAEFVINRFIPKEKRYYNTERPGFKALTWEHLMLKEKLEDGCGVLIDEAGGQADAYHYDKKDTDVRKRLDYLNKFFRQWYTDKSLLIYVDQCQGNMNTSLYKNIYYVVQCKGLDVRPSGIIPNLIMKVILAFVNKSRLKKGKKKLNNPFSVVSIEYMEFQKLGDYADHYTVNIEDKDHKKLVGSIFEFFTGQNTYVFREYNPAQKPSIPYVWGTDKETDKRIMTDNFNFTAMQQKFQNTFVLRNGDKNE